jgi:hypothetical protein
MQGFAFTSCTDFHIMYFECFVLAISVNFMYVRTFYVFMYVGVSYVKSRLYFFYHHINPARKNTIRMLSFSEFKIFLSRMNITHTSNWI